MSWKGFVAFIAMAPILALFAGIAVLAWQIGQVWDERHTDQLITGMVATCGLVLAAFLLLCVFIVAMFYFLARARERQRERQEMAGWNALPGRRYAPWAAGPPQLTDERNVGAWESMGPSRYDTWDRDAIEGEWDEGGEGLYRCLLTS